MRNTRSRTLMYLCACLSFGPSGAMGQESSKKKDLKESDYYAIRSYEIPDGVESEATSFQRMPDGQPAVA